MKNTVIPPVHFWTSKLTIEGQTSDSLYPWPRVSRKTLLQHAFISVLDLVSVKEDLGEKILERWNGSDNQGLRWLLCAQEIQIIETVIQQIVSFKKFWVFPKITIHIKFKVHIVFHRNSEIKLKLGLVGQLCNPRCLGSWGSRTANTGPAWATEWAQVQVRGN